MTTFLTAEWRQIVMVNFTVEPDVLRPLLPNGTEVDTWGGRTYLSVVGFLFLGARLWGMPVPFHSRFEEVNLRFYVRRITGEGERRGVVFIREFVPKLAVAHIARRLYDEPYTACPTAHHIDEDGDGPSVVEYRWRCGARWNSIRAESLGAAATPSAGSEEEFIAEHYWGYTALDGGRSREYEVRHEPWKVRTAASGGLDCSVADVYGPPYVAPLGREPSSIFVAEGSAVSVHHGRVL